MLIFLFWRLTCTSKLERVLVTGGAGFIGSHFVDKVVAQGYDVRVLDNLSAGKLDNIAGHLKNKKVDFVNGDIRDNALVQKCLDEVNILVHFAAQTSVTLSVDHPDFTFDVNASGTKNLLDACVKKGVGKFVLASTCAVYGTRNVCRLMRLQDQYLFLLMLNLNFWLNATVLKLVRPSLCGRCFRFFNVYGRQAMNDYTGVITKFFDRAKRKEPLIVYGDGLQTRDFVSVYDIVDALVACMTNDGVEGQVLTVGASGTPTTINDLAKTILELIGGDLPICYEKPRAGDIKDSYADISKAQKLLNYEPKVGLRDGLLGLLQATH